MEERRGRGKRGRREKEVGDRAGLGCAGWTGLCWLDWAGCIAWALHIAGAFIDLSPYMHTYTKARRPFVTYFPPACNVICIAPERSGRQ